MTMLEIMALVVLGVVAVAILLAAATKLVYLLMKGPLEARIAAHYGPDEILLKDLKANSFGLESAGVWQVRGNGGLVLTARYLHFFMFLPKREFRIPIDAITELTFTKSHLGKATIYDLLKVRFTGEGTPDSIAWYLTDPAAWNARIEALKAASSTNKPQ